MLERIDRAVVDDIAVFSGARTLIDLARTGGHSWLEREYLRLIAAAGLRTPLAQQVLTRAGDRLVRVDFRFANTPVVLEVLGYQSHRSRAQLRRDADRMNALLADGLRPYQFSYDHVVDAPADVVATTAAALMAHR